MNTSIDKKSSFSKKWYAIAPVLLALVTVLVYYPSLTYDFQFDDIYNIKKLFQLRFLESASLWMFKGSRWISYCLNTLHYHWDKFEPFVYRRSNLIFHTLTGISVFFVTLACLLQYKKKNFFTTYAFPVAFFTALLFLLHPVQTQTVSYVIQGQLEGLASLFIMLIILSYLAFCKATSWFIKGTLLIVMYTLGIVSCGTKEIAIISPVMLLLVDWFFIAQGDFANLKKRFLYLASYTLLIAFQYLKLLDLTFIKHAFTGSAVLHNNIGNVITAAPGQAIKPFTFFISQFKVIVHYMWIFVWPFNMSVDYDWILLNSFFHAECIVPLLFLLTLFAGILYLLKKDRTHLVAFGALWFFIALAPRSTFIPSTELLVDYKTYPSSFGILFLLAAALIYGFVWATKKIKLEKNTFAPFAGTLLCTALLGYATYERNKVWETSEAFWLNIIHNAPRKARAYNNYGVAIAEKKRFEEAIPYFRKAIKLDRHYPDPWSNVSVCYGSIGKTDVAIHMLRQALAINPHYPEFYNNLSSYLLQKQEFFEVTKLAQQAIKLRPHYGKAFFNWGQALYNLGDKEEGFQKIKHACLKADYDCAESFKTYGELAVKMQKYEDALIAYTHLAQYEPHNADYVYNIASAHYYLNNLEEAKKIYTALLEKNPAEYRCWFNLGELHSKQNNIPQALACYEKAQPITAQYPALPMRIAACKEQLAIAQRA